MLQYHNRRTGKVVERHAPDEWLEASGTWERIDEPELERELDDDERTDTE